MFVGDVIDLNGNFVTLSDLKKTYNIQRINFLEYFRVKILVQSFLKRYRTDSPLLFSQPCLPHHLSILYTRIQGAKVFYSVLNQPKSDMAFKAKWQYDLNINIDEKTWQQIFNTVFKLISDNNLIWFQYRLIHRILGTQNLLFKMGISTSSTCRLCNTAPETIIHLFCKCPKTIDLWEQLECWIKNMTGHRPNLQNHDKILGYLKFGSNYLPINTIILVTKSYIFSKSKKFPSLIFSELQQKIQITYNEQKLVSQIDLKNDKFDNNWNIYKNLFN